MPLGLRWEGLAGRTENVQPMGGWGRRAEEMGRRQSCGGNRTGGSGVEGRWGGGHSGESGCRHPFTCAEGQVGASGTARRHRLGLSPWESRLRVQSGTRGQAGLCACPACPPPQSLSHVLCVLPGREGVWPHGRASLQAGSPVGRLSPVVVVEAGLCSCLFASRGC